MLSRIVRSSDPHGTRQNPANEVGTVKGDENVIDAVIDISKRQAAAISAMRTALEHGDNEQALEQAKALAGLIPLARTTSTH